jgi:hypothetical protein
MWIGINTEEVQFYADHIANSSLANALHTANSQVKYAESTNATPVPLPYYEGVEGSGGSNKVVERKIDYTRQNDRSNQYILNERSFNTYFMPSFYQDYKVSYKAVKHFIEDSILDDNNNIVHYSLPNEISVIRIKLRYTYGR